MAAARIFNQGRPLALIAAATLTVAAAIAGPRVAADADLRPDYQAEAYAIKGATIVKDADSAIDDGTIIVRRGVIEAVGKADEVTIPADAETIDGKGLVVYPGFIDLYTTLGIPNGIKRSRTGPGRTVPYADFALPRTPEGDRNGLTPEFDAASVLELPENLAVEHRKLGFTSLLAAPAGAIVTGRSALVSLSGLPRREAIINPEVGLHINLQRPFEPQATTAPTEAPAVGRRRTQGFQANYPTSLMGVVAHLRQAVLDADHHRATRAYYDTNGGPRPAFDPALETLNRVRQEKGRVWWEANTRDEIHRVLDLSHEFGFQAVIVGGREAGKVADRLASEGVPVVLRVNFPEEPKAPAVSEYQKREAGERNDPLRVLAQRAAKWKERVETARDLNRAGVKFGLSSDGLAKSETFHDQVRKLIDAGLPAKAAVKALTADAASIAGIRGGTIARGMPGHLTVLSAPYGVEKAKVRYVLADGLKFDLQKSEPDGSDRSKSAKGRRKGQAPKGEAASKDVPKPDAEPKKEAPRPEAAPKGQEDQPPTGPFVDIATEFDEDRAPRIKTGGNVLIRRARILTVSELGNIDKGSILVRDGKIVAVGDESKMDIPDGIEVIDATGLVAMPGIIDTHSHMAIQGGVNEMSLSIVPEVSVRDVVDGDDPTIYRALAGGTTTARLLHGSANVIGGQDVVIKLRHGLPGRDLIFQDEKRPQGVKFALGENVTRRTNRFPNTRMGVEATIERAFEEGKAYRATWDRYNASKNNGKPLPPPRRDLRLEALARIVEGSIKIHSHCYRSDEILMLLRIAERHGVRVQSLQHVLEGYKIAPEIAAHGASASTFSDWWAYKIEAFDAIPFNAALMTEAGVSVCINSDSEELVRHLNLEAAKMVKYGGVPVDKALAMVTINSARELGLDHRIGSIEPGKDADIALFNAHPFDTFARCELALIDGEVRFQRREKDGGFAPRSTDSALKLSDARDKVIEIPENPNGVYAIVGATVHPVSGPDLKGDDATIIISKGKIVAIGANALGSTDGPATTIDARGLDVWPGLIDSGSLLGLFEIGSLSETHDYADSAQFQPELRTSSAIHPDSEIIPVTRANGILSAYVQPTGGTISGQGCVIDLDGWVPSEMVRADGVALNVSIPNYISPSPDGGRRRFGGGGAANDPNRARKERLDDIREQFRLALEYDRVRASARESKDVPPVPDPRLEALLPYAKGARPVIFRAERRQEILDALKLAKDLKVKAIISGGHEAWKVTDELKAAKVPVLIAGTLRLPGEITDPYDATYANPARLFEAGVTFAIHSIGQGPDQATSARNLPYEAATAVAFGLPESEALKALTLYPAQILGLDDQLGTIEVGKRANLVITAGPILQATTPVKALVIAGKPLAPESRHTRLYEKYRRRLSAVRNGTAILGLDRPARAVSRTEATPAIPATGTGERH